MNTKTERVEVSQEPNTLFPGRPNYQGPTSGIFAFLHHEVLMEESHNVMERVGYVKAYKPKHEIAIRLHNMMYLGGCEAVAKCAPLYADYEAKRDALYADYEAKCAPLYADYKAKRAPLYADYEAKCDALYADHKSKDDALYADYKAKRDALDAEILFYIRAHIPDCAWNGETLVFPSVSP